LENLDIGPFVYYSLAVGIAVIGLTFFVNLLRGLVLTLLGVSLAYYLFMADSASKIKMDNYMINVFKSVSGENLLKTGENILSDSMNGIKEQVEKKISEVKK